MGSCLQPGYSDELESEIVKSEWKTRVGEGSMEERTGSWTRGPCPQDNCPLPSQNPELGIYGPKGSGKSKKSGTHRTKEKRNKLDIIKIKNFCVLKDIFKKVKRQATNEKIFINHII